MFWVVKEVRPPQCMRARTGLPWGLGLQQWRVIREHTGVWKPRISIADDLYLLSIANKNYFSSLGHRSAATNPIGPASAAQQDQTASGHFTIWL